MSYVEIFCIEASGDVMSFGRARNNHGFAPCVWTKLGQKYGFLPKDAYSITHPGTDDLWAAVGTGALSRQDDVLLGATFDRIWIRKEGLDELMQAMAAFHKQYTPLCDTILASKLIIERMLMVMPDLLGIAFNMCSAVEAFWYVPVPTPRSKMTKEALARCTCSEPNLCYCTADYWRAYNVLKDGAQPWGEYKGKAAREFYAELEKGRSETCQKQSESE